MRGIRNRALLAATALAALTIGSTLAAQAQDYSHNETVIVTAERRETTAYSANAETPK